MPKVKTQNSHTPKQEECKHYDWNCEGQGQKRADGLKCVCECIRCKPSPAEWEKNFDDRFPSAIRSSLDREIHAQGADIVDTLYGKDSEYFQAIKSFIRSEKAKSFEEGIKRALEVVPEEIETHKLGTEIALRAEDFAKSFNDAVRQMKSRLTQELTENK